MKNQVNIFVLVVCLVQVRSLFGAAIESQIAWDYGSWKPISAPCPTCREARLLKLNSETINPEPLTTFSKETSVIPAQVVPLGNSDNSGIRSQRSFGNPTVQEGIQLVYLPEGSLSSLNEANLARFLPPTAQSNLKRNEFKNVSPTQNLIQNNNNFVVKQKRDHNGQVIFGSPPQIQNNFNNVGSLPMSLITSQGDEEDARSKLNLLEAALTNPEKESPPGTLPKVFIAPSHISAPPGYVKIPLISQVGNQQQEPLPKTFLTPDNGGSTIPGFVRLQLPNELAQLSKNIPVVAPDSQLGQNFFDNQFTTTPRSFQAFPTTDVNIQLQQSNRSPKEFLNNVPSIQVIPRGEPKQNPQEPPSFQPRPAFPPSFITHSRNVENQNRPVQEQQLLGTTEFNTQLPQEHSNSIDNNDFFTINEFDGQHFNQQQQLNPVPVTQDNSRFHFSSPSSVKEDSRFQFSLPPVTQEDSRVPFTSPTITEKPISSTPLQFRTESNIQQFEQTVPTTTERSRSSFPSDNNRFSFGAPVVQSTRPESFSTSSFNFPRPNLSFEFNQGNPNFDSRNAPSRQRSQSDAFNNQLNEFETNSIEPPTEFNNQFRGNFIEQTTRFQPRPSPAFTETTQPPSTTRHRFESPSTTSNVQHTSERITSLNTITNKPPVLPFSLSPQTPRRIPGAITPRPLTATRQRNVTPLFTTKLDEVRETTQLKHNDFRSFNTVRTPTPKSIVPIPLDGSQARITTPVPIISTKAFSPKTTKNDNDLATTIRVTTFKPRRKFNIRNRKRPINDIKPVTEKPEIATSRSTLFPPFAVAKTFNKPNEENKVKGSERNIIRRPSLSRGFGSRIVPRNRKRPTTNTQTKTGAIRQVKVNGEGLRRTFRRRKRPTSTQKPSLFSDLGFDIPIDEINANDISGQESVVVEVNVPQNNVQLNEKDSTTVTDKIISDVEYAPPKETFGDIIEDSVVSEPEPEPETKPEPEPEAKSEPEPEPVPENTPSYDTNDESEDILSQTQQYVSQNIFTTTEVNDNYNDEDEIELDDKSVRTEIVYERPRHPFDALRNIIRGNNVEDGQIDTQDLNQEPELNVEPEVKIESDELHDASIHNVNVSQELVDVEIDSLHLDLESNLSTDSLHNSTESSLHLDVENIDNTTIHPLNETITDINYTDDEITTVSDIAESNTDETLVFYDEGRLSDQSHHDTVNFPDSNYDDKEDEYIDEYYYDGDTHFGGSNNYIVYARPLNGSDEYSPDQLLNGNESLTVSTAELSDASLTLSSTIQPGEANLVVTNEAESEDLRLMATTANYEEIDFLNSLKEFTTVNYDDFPDTDVTPTDSPEFNLDSYYEDVTETITEAPIQEKNSNSESQSDTFEQMLKDQDLFNSIFKDREGRVLGQSVITEVRASEPLICFPNGRCVVGSGLRKKRSVPKTETY